MLLTDTVFFAVAQYPLAQGGSSSQIASTLKRMWPDGPLVSVLMDQLHKDLIPCLRRAKAKRMPRSRGEDCRDQCPIC